MSTTTVYSKERLRIRDSRSDKIYYAVINSIMILVLLVVLYPLIYILSSSFSSGNAILDGRVLLWPVEPSLDGYRIVFQYEILIKGYINSILYTLVGTVINVAITIMCAFPLARKNLPYRGFFMFLFTFTMYFSGGMIPTYLQIKNLGLLNSFWSMILPGAMSVYNMIIARTFIQNNIPNELIEASQIDGCNDYRFFFSVLIPLSKALIAVLVLYYAVAHWNAWFNAFLYLNDRDRYPLQLVLREILISNQLHTSDIDDPELAQQMLAMADLMKYSLIVLASAPMLVLYPFIQRFFITGIMIGSIKG